MWLLKQDPPAVDAQLFSSASLPKYLAFMSTVIRELTSVLAENGRICLVIGDVKRRAQNINLAREVADHCVLNLGLRVDSIIKDALPVRHKVSRIWGERRGQATKVDRILVLSRPGTTRLPPIPSVDWSEPWRRYAVD
jgi:site-specific DNA-methyltransferase (adenine-specific)